MNLFLITSAVLLVIGLGVTMLQRSRWLRWAVFSLTLISVPSVYIVGLELLGLPKPVAQEYFKKPDEVTLLGYKIVENVGFYILVDHKGFDTPLYYFMEWDKKLAEQMQEKGREARFRGHKLKLKFPFGKDVDESPRVEHPEPPAPDPLKQ